MLVVESDGPVADFLARALRTLPERPEVVVLGDGQAALHALRRRAFDLVIADLETGRADGCAVLAESARRQPAARRVLISAWNDLPVPRETYDAADVDGYLPKPFDLAHLRAVAQAALRAEALPATAEPSFVPQASAHGGLAAASSGLGEHKSRLAPWTTEDTSSA